MRQKIGIYPNFGTSTHDTLHLQICCIYELKPVTYNCIANEVNTGLYYKFYYNIIPFIYFILLNIKRKKRNSIKHRGINLSHAVIETSIRMDTYGRFVFFSKRVFDLFKAGVRYYDACINALEKYQVELIIGGDEAYIKGSILGQIAIKKGIKNIYIKQNEKHIAGFKFNVETLFAGPHFASYNIITEDIDTESDDYKFHKAHFEQIIEGRANYSYMRRGSSIKYRNELESSLEGSIVLYLHDFIDSPGIYGGSFFFDQWAWIKLAYKMCKRHNKRLVIKIHPNVSNSNAPAINLLKKKYSKSDILFLEEKISTSELKLLGICGILTLFGTVILEAAYLGIPCVSIGNHPYVSLKFHYNALTLKEYKKFLSLLCDGNLEGSSEGNQSEIIKTYIANKVAYANNSILMDAPYDDVEEEVFALLFPQLVEQKQFGINERRSVFLNSEDMKNYASKVYSQQATRIKERIDHL